MSYVTRIMLSFSIGEESQKDADGDFWFPIMEKINIWLIEKRKGQFSENIGKFSGGDKEQETPIFVGAFDCLPIEEFLAFVFSQKWRGPENVQVFIQKKGEQRFEVFGTTGVYPELEAKFYEKEEYDDSLRPDQKFGLKKGGLLPGVRGDDKS